MAANVDATFKVLLIGDSGVGKSALTFRFCDDVFFDDHAATLGVDFKYANVTREAVGGQRVRLALWDCAGQARFEAVTSQYFRGANGVLICFDLTYRPSFINVERWFGSVSCSRMSFEQ